MKLSLKSLVVVLFITMSISSLAQAKFGVKAGPNLSTMTMSVYGVSLDPEVKLGFHSGVVAEIPVSETFVIQPGLFLSTKGSKYSAAGSEASISPGFLEIPVNAMLKVSLGAPKLLVFAGPYVGYGLTGQYESDGEASKIEYGSGIDKDLKPFDFGVNLGGGIEVKNLHITAQYGLGLANLSPVTEGDMKSKMKVIGISVSYFFDN